MAVLLLADSPDGTTEHEANTLDMSQFGLRVHSAIGLTPGQVVAVVPQEGPDHAMSARVIWAGKMESAEGGEAGLEFLVPLPASA